MEPGQLTASLFERTEHNLPAWLKPSDLESENFNATKYIAEVRRYVPLDLLAREFDSFTTYIKAQLVDVINTNYSEYVSLSSRLTDVDVSVQRMKRPLMELKRRLEEARAVVQKEMDILQEQLEKRKEVAASRATLELLQDANHVVNKVKKLLLELSNSQIDQLGFTAQSRLLERAASEVAKMNFLAVTGKDLSYIRKMADRMQSTRDDLKVQLSRCLQSALTAAASNDSDAKLALPHLLHAFGVVNQTAAAERVLRDTLAAPIIRETIKTQLQQAAGPGGPPADILVQLLPRLSQEVLGRMAHVLEVTQTPESIAAGYCVLSNVVLAEITSALADLVPGAFSPALPQAFLANYAAGQRLIDDFERLCPSLTALDALRGSEAYQGFARRWNVAVYFSLRLQDTVAQVESALSSSTLVLTARSSPHDFGCQVSAALWDAVRRCFAPNEGFLPALADKFLKLALQLVSRYSQHVLQGAEYYARVRAAPSATSTAPQPGVGVDGGAEPTRAGDPGSWSAGLAPEDLAVLGGDVDRFAELLRTELPRLVQAAVPAHQQGLVAARLPAALADSLSLLGAAESRLTSLLTAAVSERCVAEVKKLRGITATYRMSARPAPSKPSMYVVGVLVPLQGFLADPRVRSQSEAARVRTVAAVAREVALRFVETARDLLESMRKTEESLKRLKKTRGQDGAEEAGGMSDSDKLALQLQLDVQEFGRQLAQLGVVPSSLQEYMQLEQAVGGPPEVLPTLTEHQQPSTTAASVPAPAPVARPISVPSAVPTTGFGVPSTASVPGPTPAPTAMPNSDLL